MRRFCSESLKISVCCLFLTMAAFAQSDRGTITGTVTDPSTAAIVAAKVGIRNVDTGSMFNTLTNNSGVFTVPSLPSGKYSVAISAPGFKTSNTSDVDVRLDQTVKVDVTLEVGQTSETISVTANSELIKTDNAEVSMNVSGRKLNELPINFSGGGSVTGGI